MNIEALARCFLFFIFQPERGMILWGRDRHKHFWNSRGYNFVSFKGMFRKLMQAIILSVFLWLPLT